MVLGREHDSDRQFVPGWEPRHGARLPVVLGGLLMGAGLLCALSLLQKLIIGAPLGVMGFIVPAAFGATVGAVFGVWRAQVQRARRARICAAEQWRALFDAAPDPALVLDDEARIVAVSSAAAAFYGVPPHEMIGRPALDFSEPRVPLPVGVPNRSKAAMERMLRDSGCESTARLRSGEERRMWCSGRAFHAPDGSRLVLRFDRDVTERQRLERQLSRASTMEAIGRTASGVAHDFNNLVQAFGTAVELVQGDPGLSANSRDFLETAQEAARRGAELAGALLAVGRGKPGERRAVDLVESVQRSESILRRALLRRSDVRIDIEPGPHTVEAVPSEIEQILLNLAVNARDAMPDGGALGIQLTRQRLEAERATRAGVGAAGDYEVLSFEDDGVGMDDETLLHLFEPFYTTKADTGGTGLGLAVVWGVATRCGGFVEVESQLGQGTRFEVWLPAAR